MVLVFLISAFGLWRAGVMISVTIDKGEHQCSRIDTLYQLIRELNLFNSRYNHHIHRFPSILELKTRLKHSVVMVKHVNDMHLAPTWDMPGRTTVARTRQNIWKAVGWSGGIWW